MMQFVTIRSTKLWSVVIYKECESVLNMFYEAHMFPPAYNNQDEDPIPLDQVEFD